MVQTKSEEIKELLGAALFTAVRMGDSAGLGTLIEQGAPADSRRAVDFATPLIVAIEAGAFECARLLLPVSDANAQTRRGETALMKLSSCAQPSAKRLDFADGMETWRESVNFIPDLIACSDVNLHDENEKTALWKAATTGHAELVQALLAAGADARTASHDDGYTALMMAAHQIGAMKINDVFVDCCRALIPFCDLRQRDKYGQTALIHAASGFGTEGVSLLLPGSDPDARDEEGLTAILHAAEGGNAEIFKALVPGCDWTLKSYTGQSARDLATENGHEEIVAIFDRMWAEREATQLRSAIAEENEGTAISDCGASDEAKKPVLGARRV